MLTLNLTGHPETVPLPDGAALTCAAIDHEVIVGVLQEGEDDESLRETVLRLAEAVIEDWSGIHDDETGSAVPFARDLVRPVMADPRVYAAFWTGYARRAFGLVAEGNGSASSPRGTGVGERATAPAARPAARRARASNTPPGQSKARRSGG